MALRHFRCKSADETDLGKGKALNWEAVGAIAEGLGAIGVVITLGLLVFQLKLGRASVEANTNAIEESRRLALAQAYQSRVDYVVTNMLALRESEHIRLFGGLDEPQSDEDRLRLRYHLTTLMNFCDNLHYQHQLGYVDHETYENQMEFTIPLYAKRWRAMGIRESREEFALEVNRFLAEETDG